MLRLAEVLRADGLYFVAELGQNHQGELPIAKRMVDSLRGTGVAAIKMAKRDIDVCLTDEQKQMPYENPHSFGHTYYEHRKALELSHDEFAELKRYVEVAGFDFISSFTDHNSLDFLLSIEVECLKIASQRLRDTALLQRAAKTGLPVIASTGMSTLDDVDRAVEILAGSRKYLLQCTSAYPCPDADLNLRVIQTFLTRFGAAIDGVGFSGHHAGIAPDLAAYALGARIIERHYTLDRSMRGSDHAASLEREDVERILAGIDRIRTALGSAEKAVLPSEHAAIRKLRSDMAFIE